MSGIRVSSHRSLAWAQTPPRTRDPIRAGPTATLQRSHHPTRGQRIRETRGVCGCATRDAEYGETGPGQSSEGGLEHRETAKEIVNRR